MEFSMFQENGPNGNWTVRMSDKSHSAKKDFVTEEEAREVMIKMINLYNENIAIG
jgi:hypothetical protein